MCARSLALGSGHHDMNVVVCWKSPTEIIVASARSPWRNPDTVTVEGMASRTKRPASAVAVLAPAALAPLLLFACFDSDELRGNESESESTGSETVTMYSDETDEGSDDSWTAEETGPSETTCRDAIDCLVICQTALIFNPQPEPDLSCFFECDMGLSTEEAYKLIELAECIGIKCAMDPDGVGPDVAPCGPESTDNDCLLCIAENGQDPQPPGCQEEAAACE
jgi:hypothetical protein